MEGHYEGDNCISYLDKNYVLLFFPFFSKIEDKAQC